MPGTPDGLEALGGETGDDVAVGVEVHVAGGAAGGLLAVVEEVGFAGFIPDEHKSASAEVAGQGVDDGEGKTDGHGGVDGVAALLEDGEAGVGGVVLRWRRPSRVGRGRALRRGWLSQRSAGLGAVWPSSGVAMRARIVAAAVRRVCLVLIRFKCWLREWWFWIAENRIARLGCAAQTPIF